MPISSIILRSCLLVFVVALGSLLVHRRNRAGKPLQKNLLSATCAAIVFVASFLWLYGLIPLWGSALVALIEAIMAGAIAPVVFSPKTTALVDRSMRRKKRD